MNHIEARRYWTANAEVWTQLSRAGYDVYRDDLNTPAVFNMLPDVSELKGIDIGCGEGYNTRLLAEIGALMTAIDISEVFIQKASEVESSNPFHINYQVASAVDLPFENEQFDFATGFMSFMDVPETDEVISEAFRVLKPGGFLQFSITHPCFDTPHRKNIKNEDGKTYAVEVGDYFLNQDGNIDEWMFKSAPPHLRASVQKFKVPRFTRTLSQWINALTETGFMIESLQEPRPDDATVQSYPKLQPAQTVAYFLHILCRKPM